MESIVKERDTVYRNSVEEEEDIEKIREISSSSKEDDEHVDHKTFEAKKKLKVLNGLYREPGDTDSPTPLTQKNLSRQSLQQSHQIRNVISRHSTSRSVRSYTSAKDLAHIVRDLDRSKGTSFKQFEAWKKTKWGEGEVDGVELDPDDFDLEVFGDVVIPSRGEIYHHFKKSFGEAYNYFTNESYLKVKGSIWNWCLDLMKAIPTFIQSQFEGEELTFWQLLLGLVKIISSFIYLIFTVSGLKLLMTVFDKPLLLKINYLPTDCHPKTRYSDRQYSINSNLLQRASPRSSSSPRKWTF